MDDNVERQDRDPQMADLDHLMNAMGHTLARRVEQRSRRRTLGIRWAVAAAAAVLILSIGPRPSEDRFPRQGTQPQRVELDVESSRSFAVFPTSDSDLTVIWLLDTE